jgi:hypothetical protein
MLLEERKAAPQYKALFDAEPAAMETDNIKQEHDNMKQEHDNIKQEDHSIKQEATNAAVDVKPVVGLKQEPMVLLLLLSLPLSQSPSRCCQSTRR